uniref:Laccase n=1 Tax=Pholiota microspora TaxID=1538424 RepID=A0A160PPY8_PHOMI|nr:laccase [Pholiota microspora]
MREFLLILVHLFVPLTYALGPHANLYIRNRNITPDGYNRSAVLAGATPNSLSFPGPTLTGVKGDMFRLNVVNQLMDTNMLISTSIHWHGITQKGSSWADGPVGVTQCPIAPGHSFEYQFSVPDQAGTFWYHSHYSTQYCDGLRGVIVVYDRDDPHRTSYDIDDESTVITLADWYHGLSPILGANKIPPIPDSTLINGKGRSKNGTIGELTVITVAPHLRYRFRLVSISCYPNFTFSIDGHDLTVIEVDGTSIRPLIVNSIQIFAGQRYSFVLCADQRVSNYWIRSLPNQGPQGFDNAINSAILRYVGAAAHDPRTIGSLVVRPLSETSLSPLVRVPTPGILTHDAADININLDINVDLQTGIFYMNNATFVPPSVPVLLQIMSGVQAADALLPTGSVYSLPPNKVVELTIPGGSIGSPHPIHLHGHSFAVVRSAGSTIYNYHNPVIRDVVNVGTVGDNVTIRFVTDNAGPWILHCHIDWHLEHGLAVVFAENTSRIRHKTPPAAWDRLCKIFDAFPGQL